MWDATGVQQNVKSEGGVQNECDRMHNHILQ